MADRKSDPSSGSGERLLIFLFLVLVILVAARWVLSLWGSH
jgi:flagellar basal body-associated protein FliL